MRLGNPHGRKPFTAEVRRKGAEALRQQAHARAQQLSEILAEFAGQSANAIAKALDDRKLGGDQAAGLGCSAAPANPAIDVSSFRR